MLPGLTLILIAASLGWLILNAVGGARLAFARWHLFYPIGAGVLTFAIFVMSWMGVPISRASAAILASGLAAVLVLLILRRRAALKTRPQGNSSTNRYEHRFGRDRVLITGSILILALAALVLSIGRAYSSWDAMAIWSVKGYGIALEGTVGAGAEWGSKALMYPLNLPLQIAVFDLFTGDWLPQSKLIFPLYYLALLMGLHRYLRRHTSTGLAATTVLLIAASPMIFDHATNGYANLPFTTYLVLGFLALLEAGPEADRPLELAGGLLLGLATWTRPEGVYIVACGALALWLAQRLTRQGGRFTARWIVPALLMALPWQAFTMLGGYQSGTVASFGRGLGSLAELEIRLSNVYWILRYFVWQAVQPAYWGVATPATALILALAIWRGKYRIDADQIRLVSIAAGVILATGAYFYLAGFREDLNYLLSTSVERTFMPGMILGLVGVNMRRPSPSGKGD